MNTEITHAGAGQTNGQQMARTNEGGAMLDAILQAAQNPDMNVDKLKSLFDLHERMQTRQAETAYAEAFAAMQVKLPSIGERGDAAGRYTFALWEDINAAIKPVLSRFGFALSFRTDFTSGISVTGVLQHKSGHKETTSITLPADPSGNKNAVQAVASSVSYGKRYAAGALLNLTSHGEDDDAYSTVAEPEPAYLDWHEAIRGAFSADELRAVKKEMADKFGADKVPAVLVRAYNARLAEVRA